jgi:VanZ family protein
VAPPFEHIANEIRHTMDASNCLDGANLSWVNRHSFGRAHLAFVVPFLHWLDPQMPYATVVMMQLLIRKLGHLTEYAILAVLLWRALRGSRSFQTRLTLLFMVAWFACALFAASDEFHQSFVPSRTPAVHDVMIDVCGAAIGLLICFGVARRKTASAVVR